MFKKFTLLFLVIATCSLSYAQTKYGFKIGAAQSFVKDRWQQPNTENSLKAGLQIGAILYATLLKNLSIRPSLQLTQKGYKSVAGNPEGPFYWNKNLSTTYIELPADVVYNVPLNKDVGIFIGTGPVLGFGLYGKLKAAFAITNNAQQVYRQNSTSNKIFNNQTDKRFDLGWDFLMGLQCHKMTISANYNHGLLNIIRDGSQSLKNRSFALTIGYLINK